MPLLAPVTAAHVEVVEAYATILAPHVPTKAAAPTMLRAAANAANAAVPALAPPVAGTEEARTAPGHDQRAALGSARVARLVVEAACCCSRWCCDWGCCR